MATRSTAAADGEERPRVRRRGARPADVLAVEGTRARFRAEKDYGQLITAALPALKPGGVLLASTNAGDWPPEKFLGGRGRGDSYGEAKNPATSLRPATTGFPDQRAEPAYLKTVWLKIG